MPKTVKKITLRQFVEQETARLIRFEQDWRERMTKNESGYESDVMEPGEWDQQLILFDS